MTRIDNRLLGITRHTQKLFAAIVCCCLTLAASFFSACSGDPDQYSLESFYEQYRIIPDTFSIAIAWNGAAATVTGDTDSVSIAVSGADVTVTSSSNRFMELTLSGETSDGSLLVYSDVAWGMILNGVSITNADGPAINNQCSKWLYVTLNDGTVNTFTDGTTYADAPINGKGEAIDQKATFFSEGQIWFGGTGSLAVNGKGRNGIASDDYVVLDNGNITINVEETGTNGLKVNDGLTILGGMLTIDVLSDGGRGVKNDARTTISGGTTTITTSGDYIIENIDGVRDTTSAAGIKCDSLFTMTAGTLTITSSGDGGKGINCADTVLVSGGTLTVSTKGDNDVAKPKAIKGEKGIIVSGGSFLASCENGWACDNGTDSSDPKKRVTVKGTPIETPTLTKKKVIIKF